MSKKLQCVKDLVDKYTTSDMTISNEVRYPGNIDLITEEDSRLWAFNTHSQTALLNY